VLALGRAVTDLLDPVAAVEVVEGVKEAAGDGELRAAEDGHTLPLTSSLMHVPPISGVMYYKRHPCKR
jgi:hypothetical protein